MVAEEVAEGSKRWQKKGILTQKHKVDHRLAQIDTDYEPAARIVDY